MTPKKQVSPAIRILRGERDASARATHLEAATRKFLVTTNERKQMSTTTNFKRIALVAVAALGLGVLSSVPSQATINSDAVTLSSATAAQTTAETYTATSAVATVSFFGAAQDSLTITAALVSTTAVGNTSMPVLRLVETSSAAIDSLVATAGAGAYGNGGSIAGTGVLANTATRVAAMSSSVTTTAKYAVYLATSGATTAAPTTAGTYVIKLTPAAIGVGPLVGATAQTLTITVTTAASQSTTPSATTSTAFMTAGEPADLIVSTATADSSVVVVKTLAASTNAASIYATVKNAAGSAIPATAESLTATIVGSGMLGSHAVAASAAATGRTISVKIGDFIGVFSDGTAGTGTITIKGATSGVQIGTVKTVTFTATTPTSFGAAYIAATDSSVVKATGTTKVWSKALDGTNPVQGLVGGTSGDYWVISSDTSVVTVTTYPGSMDTTELGYGVVVTGVAVGTATLTFANASTLAAATIKSAPVTVRVGSETPSNVTVTTDKASYAPGEKITMTVTILDSTAKAVVGKTTYSDIFSATGVTASMGLQSGTLPTANISDYSNVTNTKTFTLYAPVNGGTLTFSWTGGTGLATANQVAKTTVVTVTDSGAAALAAVTALATTVASLKTLITTLTNLVLKIQKKVKA